MRFALVAAPLFAVYLLTYPMPAEAISDDDELSIMAAEQRQENDANVTVRDDVEVFENRSAAIRDDDNESIETGTESVEPSKPVESVELNNTEQPSSDISNDVKKNEPSQDNVAVQNPIVTYSNFEDAAKNVGFIPLYIPRKSGFAMNYIAVISGNIVEIRYGRRWEPTVTLSVRTYKRAPGEELKDISGVHGVKWKVDLSSGMTIYIARVNNNTNAAAWSIGQYTFAAMTENLSFAAFHAFIVEELVDLCNHYFISI